MHIFFENIHKFLISGIHVNKSHVNSGNHYIFGSRITEIKHIVDHLLFFPLNNTVFLPYIYHRTKLMLCDGVFLRIGINTKEKKNAVSQFSHNVNNRGQYCHKRIYRSGIGERQIIRFQCGNGLRGNLAKQKYQ